MAGPKAQQTALKIAGLFTDPNTFSEIPQGLTLSRATNVVIDKDSIINSRRGLTQYNADLTNAVLVKAFIDFKDTLIISKADGTLLYENGSNWTAYSGTYLPPSGLSADRISSYQANKNLYFSTSAGVYKLGTINETPRVAGVSAGLGGSGVTTGSAGFMTTATNVAYRIIWGYRDSNENLILGAPSDRIVVSNTSGGDRDVILTFFIPAEINTTYFYQVYRSSGSATINDQPDDELQLVYEASPTSGEVTAGILSITDSTVDELRGALIYTAPSLSVLGAANANYQPPFCTTLCTFNNHAFYGNTRSRHSLTSTLIATGTPNLQINDTITFTTGATAFTITAKAAENAAAGEFFVETSLTPAENIDITARSIITVLNTYAANTFIDAYYTSGFDELPGRMLFNKNNLSETAFTITTTRGDSFRPVLPVSGSNYNNTSRNEVRPNRVYFSKLQEYEAVPLVNFFDIGSPEEPIRALVPLRDGIIILKTDGIYRLSGVSSSSFSVNPIDRTVSILAQYSVAVLSNRVFFFSEQGIVAVSDNAAEIISRPIETDLLQLSSSVYPNFSEVTFAIGYESDRKYILNTVSTASDTVSQQSFVFNTLTGDWTRWDKPISAGIVKSADDTLYVAGPLANDSVQSVFHERKNYNLSDFADEQYITPIITASSYTITIADTSKLQVGYTIQQTTATARIAQILNSSTLVMDSVQDWVTGANCTIYRPIFQSFESNQFDAGSPGIMKHWADCSVIFRTTNWSTLDLGFTADTTNDIRTVTLNRPAGGGGWGTFPWGTLPWGLSIGSKARVRTTVPKQAMRSNWLSISCTLNEAFTDLSIAGVTFTFSEMSSRQKSGSIQ